MYHTSYRRPRQEHSVTALTTASVPLTVSNANKNEKQKLKMNKTIGKGSGGTMLYHSNLTTLEVYLSCLIGQWRDNSSIAVFQLLD